MFEKVSFFTYYIHKTQFNVNIGSGKDKTILNAQWGTGALLKII